MLSNLNLSKNTIRIIRFILAFCAFMFFDWESFQDNPTRLFMNSAILSTLIVWITEITDNFKDEDTGHVIYSSLHLENEIINKVESLGYKLKSSTIDSSIYSKSKSWTSKKIKIVKTEHFLKVEVPKKFVEQFEQFVR